MLRRRVPINKDVLRARISYIEDSRGSLERFRGISYEEFHSNPDHFRIAFYDLHRSLEAIMDIGSHILSRIPGARPSSYKDIPQLLEKHKIIPSDFADGQLTKMAGYRNRMVRGQVGWMPRLAGGEGSRPCNHTYISRKRRPVPACQQRGTESFTFTARLPRKRSTISSKRNYRILIPSVTILMKF